MANPWFRMYHEFATDPKVQMLSEADQRRFVMLLCLCCSNDDETLQDVAVAFQLRISNEEYQQTKATLLDAGLIDESNKPLAWDKRQFASDSSTARVRAYRKKQKQQRNVTETKSNALDTDTDTDTDNKTLMSDSGESAPCDGEGEIPKIPPCPVQQIVDLYHKTLPELPAVQVLSEKRRSQIKARWRENDSLKTLDGWQRYFEFVRSSDFLMGRVDPANGRQHFIANLEWLTKSTNFINIVEGKYHDQAA